MARCSISIILTINNSGNDNISNCLDSILSQGAWDYEIIIVNNGSPDGYTIEICENYRTQYSQIKIIHMEQSELTLVYNKGLDIASCRYVHFMEVSGCLEEDALVKIAPFLLESYDVIFIDTTFYGRSVSWNRSHGSTLRRLIQKIPDRLWDKVIRRDLLLSENISFSDGITWECVDFCMNLYIHAKVYGAVDFKYYRHTAETNIDDEEMFHKVMLTISKWAGPAETVYREYGTYIQSWMAGMYCDLLIPAYSRLSRGARRIYKPGMDDFRWLIDMDANKNRRMLGTMYSLFGLYLLSKIISVFNKNRSAGG